MPKGRCMKCRIAYRWVGSPRLQDAACPRCRRPLDRTTHLLKSVPWVDQDPVLRPTDGKGYLCASDARQAAQLVRERVYPLAEALKESGVSISVVLGPHAVTITARVPANLADAYFQSGHVAKVWVHAPTEADVDYALACAVGHVIGDHGPHSLSSFSGGDWVRSAANNDAGQAHMVGLLRDRSTP